MRQILLMAGCLFIVGCDKSDDVASLGTEVSVLSARLVAAETRIEVLENFNKNSPEAKAKEESDQTAADHLDRLRSDQQQVQRSQKMLCDATGDC